MFSFLSWLCTPVHICGCLICRQLVAVSQVNLAGPGEFSERQKVSIQMHELSGACTPTLSYSYPFSLSLMSLLGSVPSCCLRSYDQGLYPYGRLIFISETSYSQGKSAFTTYYFCQYLPVISRLTVQQEEKLLQGPNCRMCTQLVVPKKAISGAV